MATFASRFKQLCKEAELSGSELGRLVGLSKQAISTYRTGGSSPNNETLGRLADVFHVTVDYLLGRTDERQPSQVREGVAVWLDGGGEDLTPDELAEWRGYADWLRARRKPPTPEGT